VSLSPALGLAVLRVTLGVIFAMHGYLAAAVIGPAGIAGYTARMGYPAALGPALAWYLILAHGIGGILLVLGVATRWAALAQLPIMLSALLLHHLQQGFFLTGIVVDAAAGRAIAGGYEYVLLVVAATVTLVLAGGGRPALGRP
jgi:putative oxidoreductase